MTAGDWRRRALCANADPEAAFARTGSAELNLFIEAFCGPCPVAQECLSHAMRSERHLGPGGVRFGVYGGLTAADRARLARFGTRPCDVCGTRFIPATGSNRRCPAHRRPNSVADPGPVRKHGTAAGYSQHRRRNEVPCVACRLARNERDRGRAKRGLWRGAA